MSEGVLWVPGPLPGLNELLDMRAANWRGKYSAAKKRAEHVIAACIYSAQLAEYQNGAHLAYELVERDRRRDPGNVFAGASKLIEDALVRTMVLPSDGWRGVLSYAITWRVDKASPGVLVRLRP